MISVQGETLTISFMHDTFDSNLATVNKWRKLGRSIAGYMANLRATDILHTYGVAAIRLH